MINTSTISTIEQHQVWIISPKLKIIGSQATQARGNGRKGCGELRDELEGRKGENPERGIERDNRERDMRGNSQERGTWEEIYTYIHLHTHTMHICIERERVRERNGLYFYFILILYFFLVGGISNFMWKLGLIYGGREKEDILVILFSFYFFGGWYNELGVW